jgi:hypothetical protein
MPVSLTAVAQRIETAVKPFGCTAKPDRRTDNVIVLHGERGFVVTRQYIDDYGPLSEKITKDAALVACDLAAGKDESMIAGWEKPVSLLSKAELENDSNLTTAFDRHEASNVRH